MSDIRAADFVRLSKIPERLTLLNVRCGKTLIAKVVQGERLFIRGREGEVVETPFVLRWELNGRTRRQDPYAYCPRQDHRGSLTDQVPRLDDGHLLPEEWLRAMLEKMPRRSTGTAPTVDVAGSL